MINVTEAKINDCCYFLLPNERKPRFGTITSVFLNESGVQVLDPLNGGYYVVWEKNAAWDESELKGKKWEKPHNYHRDIPEIIDEKKPDERKRNVHNRPKTKTKVKRTSKKDKSATRGSNRKQKTVRSS
jgi:hypothetical protein